MSKTILMIKVIAVDFGGVYFTYSFEKLVKQLSKLTGVESKIVKKGRVNRRLLELHVKKISEKGYWRAFCKTIGKEVKHSDLQRITENQFKPIKSVIQLMKRLRKRYKIVLLANQTVMLDRLDEKYRFYKNFDLLLSSHIVKVQKPHKSIFKLLLKKTKCKPEEIMFIDDSRKNIAAARRLGINAILFRNIKQLKKKLPSFGIKA